MKNVLNSLVLMLLLVIATSCAGSNDVKATNNDEAVTAVNNGVIYLDKAGFLEKVFNYEKNKEWKFAGDKPVIVDFYADWCGPCRMLSPVLEELQKDYGGKLQVYKVDTEKERELAAAFGIQSLPTVIFIPKEGQPQAVMGFRPKEELEKIVSEVLKVTK